MKANTRITLEYSFKQSNGIIDKRKSIKEDERYSLIDLPRHIVPMVTNRPDDDTKVFARHWWEGHTMTLMGTTLEDGDTQFDFIQPDNRDDEYKECAQLSQLVNNFLLNRATLSDHYDSNVYQQYTEQTSLMEEFKNTKN